MSMIRECKPVHLRTSAGKLSGCVVLDGILHRVVQGSRHQLRRPPAWAFERQILDGARALGATVVRVKDTETGITYTATLDAFDRHGITIRRGFGEQIALPLNLWQRSDEAQQPTLF